MSVVADPGEGAPVGDTITVPAEPGDPASPASTDPNGDKPATKPAPAGKTFSEEDVARIRKEEKDKLYPQMQSMQDELKKIKDEQAADEKARKEEAKRINDEAKQKKEADMDTRQLLDTRQREWEERERERDAQFAALSSEIDRRDALLQQERRLNSLMEYRRAAIEANSEAIIPELRDLVTGGSEEEVDASVASLIERSNRILEQVSATRSAERREMRTAPITSPSVGPMDNEPGQETLTADEIRNMDMATYQKYRDRLIGAAGRGQNRGMYG